MSRRRASTEDMDPLSFAVSQRDRMVMDMVREALNTSRLLLAFQPIMSITGSVAFHEGFIRLLDDTGRAIPAGQFMGVVETQEMGRLIDCAALRFGLGALARHKNLRLAINMSARSIGYPKWQTILKRGLNRDATVAERLILEINETSALQVPELVTTFMDELLEQGITFALDDFGAELTSFRFLRDTYFDLIKIDGAFVRNCDKNPDSQNALRAIVHLAKNFEMFTVAENVETQGEANFLASIGVDCLQGYYYGAPEVRPSWFIPPNGRAVLAS